MINDFIAVASRLAQTSPRKPRQAELRRAVSTAYYALFHATAKNVADTMIGTSRSGRARQAWAQAYHGLQHGDAKLGCEAVRNLDFPPAIKECADSFVLLQKARHAADYDPLYRLTREDALTLVREAEKAIAKLRSAGPEDRRAFAVQTLVRRRSHG